MLADIFSQTPVRQWVLSPPIPLRGLLAAHPERVTPVFQVVQRAVKAAPDPLVSASHGQLQGQP